MTVREQAGWWGAGLLAFIAILWVFAEALTPFLLGAAIAYFADPLADKLEARGLNRAVATTIITLLAMLMALGALIVMIPLVIDQVQLAVKATPGLIGDLKGVYEGRIAPLVGDLGFEGDLLGEALARAQEQLQAISGAVLSSAWSVGMAGIEALSLIVITPVVAFYLLLDWDRLIARLDDLTPREHTETVRELARRVDAVLAGFVRGQLTVCLILGGFYALGLILVQLPFGLLIGLAAGLISFIPFVGAILGGAMSVGVALVHFWDDPVRILIVAAIFGAGQAIEGNVLSPKLVGGSVGLHPVWLMFALSAFGLLFGFAGLLVAVPAAAVIGVFLRFFIDRYKQSRLYLGPGGTGDA